MFKVSIDIESAMVNLESVLRSGYVNEGKEVTQFSKLLSDDLGVKNLVLMNSCTSALTVAYRLAGVNIGTEVISSPMTCVATNTPITNLGAKIKWCDIFPDTGNINVDRLESLISDRTRAIVYVNWAGNPAELEKIWDIGRKYGIKVIQDAAHAYGATWKDQSVAEYADFTCYSFQAIKHLSCGDGGALVCKEDADFLLARKLKWFGYDREATKDTNGEWKGQRWDADIELGEVGYKFNMNNIAAAIGISGLQTVRDKVNAHRQNAEVYIESFSKNSFLTPLEIPKEALSSYWAFTALINSRYTKLRDELIVRLNEAGIGAGLIHLPNDIYSAFSESRCDLPGVREFERRQISFPCGWWISVEESKLIAEEVKRIMFEMTKNYDG